MRIVLVLALVAVAAAQVPQRCETPKQWESKRDKLDRAKMFGERAIHVYDEVNERQYTKEEVALGKEVDYYQKLYLHKEKKEYALNLKTKKCNVTTLTTPFRPTKIPMEANFVDEVEIGVSQIPREHLTAQIWAGNFTDGAEFLLSVTTPDCVPISFDVINPKTEEHFSERYFDFHIGIKNMSVFDIPPECM